jgi:RNA polymerase sigma-70 factor (ECF subfamily)
MQQSDLISLCLKNDKAAKKEFFELYYSKLAYIGLRYSKNSAQSEQVVLKGFTHIFENLHDFNQQSTKTLEEFVTDQFITFVVKYIKNIRNEYYVASTVRAVEHQDKSYDLFLDHVMIDLKNINPEVLLISIQELVPSQRLVFNLFVIDTYSLSAISDLLETSEQTIKSNLEKARFSLQKSIEKNLKQSNNEQPV